MTERLTPGELIFLGTGTSHGVPMIGCDCGVCTSYDARNQRSRSSVILGLPGGNLLIDTSPDMRTQFIRQRLRYAHAILYTHAHSDHLLGLDDTRIFSLYLYGAPIQIFCEATVEAEIRQRFSYIFDPAVQLYPAGGIPKLDIRRITPGVPFSVLGAEVLPLRFEHGRADILGFRIGDMAYCTDVKFIPPETLPHLYGLDTLILGCLRYRPHLTHMNVEEALAVVAELKPRRTFFTHLCHDLDHAAFTRQLPENIAPAYDSLSINVKWKMENGK